MELRTRAEAIIFKDGKVLANVAKGYVCFPGGGIDPHESAVQAAKRECLEEADRILIGCTPAHAVTTQLWSEKFKARKADWCKGFVGGKTHWMTGCSSWSPYHPDPRMRHEDYEPGFDWYAPEKLLARLSDEVDGDWADDVKVRRSILTAHIEMYKTSMFPRLYASIAEG